MIDYDIVVNIMEPESSFLDRYIQDNEAFRLELQQALTIFEQKYSSGIDVTSFASGDTLSLEDDGETPQGRSLDHLMTEIQEHLDQITNPDDLDPKYQLLLKLHKKYQKEALLYDILVKQLLATSIALGSLTTIIYLLHNNFWFSSDYKLNYNTLTSFTSALIPLLGVLILITSYNNQNRINLDGALLKVFAITDEEARDLAEFSKRFSALHIPKQLTAKRKLYLKNKAKQQKTETQINRNAEYRKKIEDIGSEYVSQLRQTTNPSDFSTKNQSKSS